MSISASLFEPLPEPALGSAADWLTALLAGSAATAVCVIAVGAFGMLMLTGRISLRRGFRVLLGCSLLLGASTLAAGLQGLGREGAQSGAAPSPQVIEVQSIPKPLPPAHNNPYAGASLRRQ